MSTVELQRYRTFLLVVAAGILVWGVLGALDVRNQTYTGYLTDGNNTITQVAESSPADAAGLEVGDYIRSIGGISVEDLAAAAQRLRPVINEVRTIEVERDGRAVRVDLTYGAPPLRTALVLYGAILIGFLFLACGVWAFLAAPGRTTVPLSVLGIAFSVGLTVGPYFTSAAVRTAVGIVVLLLIIVGFAVLTHFLLVFPKTQVAAGRSRRIWVVYGPAVVVGLLAVWLLVAQPAATSALNVFFRVLFGLFTVAYFGASLIVLIRGYVRAAAQDRVILGLNVLLVGAVVGLGPWLVLTLLGVVAPRFVFPGAQLLLLSLGFLPVMFALAAVRAERAVGAR